MHEWPIFSWDKFNAKLLLRRVAHNHCEIGIYCNKYVLHCIVVGSRRLMPPDALQPKAYCTNPRLSRSYLHCQVSPPQTLVMKGWTTWERNDRWILPENVRLPLNIQGSFTCRKSTTWDKRLYFPSEGRRAEDFFALKNPTASAGFELINT